VIASVSPRPHSALRILHSALEAARPRSRFGFFAFRETTA